MMELAMKTQARWAALLLAFVLVPAGCSDRNPDERQPTPAPRAAPAPAPEATPAPEQRPPTPSTPATPEPAPEPRAGKEPAPATKPPATPPEPAKPEPTKPEPALPEPAKPEPAPEPARPQEPAPATPSTPQQPVATEAGKTMANDVVILTGSPLGGVRLAHTLHAERAGNACTTCHHPSRPEQPATAPQQACSDCHTKVAAAPMTTKYQAAFHNPTAQSGTCIDCHKAENAKGKSAPVKCAECHKKENS